MAAAAAVAASESFGGRFAKELLTTAATVAFAVAGAGALLERWQRREWRRRTQFIAFDLLERTGHELGLLASALMRVYVTAFVRTDRESITRIEDAFQLPRQDAQAAVWEEATAPIEPIILALMREEHRAWQIYERHLAIDTERAEAEQTRLDKLRREAHLLAELVSDADSAQPEEQLARASPLEDADIGAPAGPELSLDTIAALIDDARVQAEELATRAEAVYTYVQDAAAYADALAEKLLTTAIELRIEVRTLTETAVRALDDPDPNAPSATQAADCDAKTAGRAREIAVEAQVALWTSSRLVDVLSEVYTKLRAATQGTLPRVLTVEREYSDSVKALTDLSITMRLRAASMLRQLDHQRHELEQRRPRHTGPGEDPQRS